jgi:hypothetical protein
MRRATNRRPIEPVLSETRGLISCSGKRCYESQPVAAKLAKRVRRSRDHERVEAYHCGHCKSWHIGSVQPKQKILTEARRRKQEIAE